MFLMVLNDGETYTSLGGCKMLWVADDVEGDDVDEIVKTAWGEHDVARVAVVREFGLTPDGVDFQIREG